jgi:hypothetical protein
LKNKRQPFLKRYQEQAVKMITSLKKWMNQARNIPSVSALDLADIGK